MEQMNNEIVNNRDNLVYDAATNTVRLGNLILQPVGPISHMTGDGEMKDVEVNQKTMEYMFSGDDGPPTGIPDEFN